MIEFLRGLTQSLHSHSARPRNTLGALFSSPDQKSNNQPTDTTNKLLLWIAAIFSCIRSSCNGVHLATSNTCFAHANGVTLSRSRWVYPCWTTPQTNLLSCKNIVVFSIMASVPPYKWIMSHGYFF